MKQIDVETAFRIFKWGIDVGQLFAEQERENEEFGEAWKGYAVARRTAMPMQGSTRRQLHSEKWFEAKRASLQAFQSYLGEIAK